MEKAPNWLDMPDELMTNIFQRLRTVEKLTARKVCTTWRRLCDDPMMLKVINMYNAFDYCRTDYLDYNSFDYCRTDYLDYCIVKLTQQAVDLSCGELIDISIKNFGTHDLLDYIFLRSSELKRLCLISCKNITGSELSKALKRVPQLEKLHLYNICIKAEDIKVIGRNCPRLKSFIMMYSGKFINCDDRALAIANNMPGLCHLKVDDKQMTNDGLKAILNGCPHLQSLDVSRCPNLYLEWNYKLGKLCVERITDFKYGWGSINSGRLFRR